MAETPTDSEQETGLMDESPISRSVTSRGGKSFAMQSFSAGFVSGLVLIGVGYFALGRSSSDEDSPSWSWKPASTSSALDLSLLPERSQGPPACHDVQEHENSPCIKAMQWGRSSGWFEHPEWFGGLTNRSSVHDWQAWTSHGQPWGKCPIPCDYKPDPICFQAQGPVPQMWRPAPISQPLDIKILSYNLYWWHLFDLNKGKHAGVENSAGKLIKSTGPYDVIGFQECKDHKLVLEPVGLLEEYEAFEGWREICIAYRKKAWTLLGHGTRQVSVDQSTEWYGTRGTQWIRLQHKETGQRLFFGNHHGPLSVNSGGQCGGEATARNMLKLVADKAQVGDAVVIVGDFNANALSLTVQELWKNLVLLYNGKSFGGVDNVFGNMPLSSVVDAQELGTGGSDHQAVSTTVHLGPRGTSLRSVSPAAQEPHKAQHDSSTSQCGLLENDLEYMFSSPPSRTIPHLEPRACCTACKTAHCKAWTYLSYDESVKGNICRLYSTEATSWRKRYGAVSGLAPVEAARRASKAMSEAISEIPAASVVA